MAILSGIIVAIGKGLGLVGKTTIKATAATGKAAAKGIKKITRSKPAKFIKKNITDKLPYSKLSEKIGRTVKDSARTVINIETHGINKVIKVSLKEKLTKSNIVKAFLAKKSLEDDKDFERIKNRINKLSSNTIVEELEDKEFESIKNRFKQPVKSKTEQILTDFDTHIKEFGLEAELRTSSTKSTKGRKKKEGVKLKKGAVLSEQQVDEYYELMEKAKESFEDSLKGLSEEERKLAESQFSNAFVDVENLNTLRVLKVRKELFNEIIKTDNPLELVDKRHMEIFENIFTKSRYERDGVSRFKKVDGGTLHDEFMEGLKKMDSDKRYKFFKENISDVREMYEMGMDENVDDEMLRDRLVGLIDEMKYI